jgi:hypothetical protein
MKAKQHLMAAGRYGAFRDYWLAQANREKNPVLRGAQLAFAEAAKEAEKHALAAADECDRHDLERALFPEPNDFNWRRT